MPGVSFIFVGKMREKYFEGAFAEYLKRISGYTKCEVREITEQRLGDRPSQREIDAALAREAQEIEKAIPKGAYVAALCVEGEMCSSEQLAQKFSALDGRGVGAEEQGRLAAFHVQNDFPAPLGPRNAGRAGVQGFYNKRRDALPQVTGIKRRKVNGRT